MCGECAEAEVVALDGRLPRVRVDRDQDEHGRAQDAECGEECGAVPAQVLHSRPFQRSLPASRRTSAPPSSNSAHGCVAATGAACRLAVWVKTLGSTIERSPKSAL